MEIYHYQMAATFARVVLGMLLLMQGFDKVFRIKIKGVADTYIMEVPSTPFPRFMVYLVSFYTSYVEFLGGLILILGLFTYPALYFIALDLAIACLGMSSREPLWDMKYVWPRLALLIFLLAIPAEWNQWSLDYLFKI